MRASGVDAGQHGQEWTDLAGRRPGDGVLAEATRARLERRLEGDRPWRVGADGEAAVGELLDSFVRGSWWARLRRRPPRWQVLHDVPFVTETGRPCGDIDHLLIGPPGVLALNTKHHPTGLCRLDGDVMTVNRRAVDHIGQARRQRAAVLDCLRIAGATDLLVDHTRVRPVVVIVGGRLVVSARSPGVLVTRAAELMALLRALPPVLSAADVETLYDIARRSTTWIRRG